MYTLFQRPQLVSSRQFAYPAFDYIRQVFQDSIYSRYRELRKNNAGYIPSNHLLLNLLSALNVEFSGVLPYYMQDVEAQLPRVTGVMGYASSLHHGRVFDRGTFYGDSVREIYLVHAEDVNPLTLWNNWENLSAVRVLAHPFTSFNAVDLNGTAKVIGASLVDCPTAVLAINVPLLAAQFELWKLTRRALPEGGRTPDANFISQIVLPNLLPSHLDVVVRNRVAQRITERPGLELDTNLPFYQTDLEPRLSSAVDEIVERITGNTMTFDDILRNIPAISVDNQREAVRLPETAYTNQVLWVLYSARLELVSWLLQLANQTQNAKNTAEINRIKRSLIEAESGKYLVNGLPGYYSQAMQTFIQDQITPYLP